MWHFLTNELTPHCTYGPVTSVRPYAINFHYTFYVHKLMCYFTSRSRNSAIRRHQTHIPTRQTHHWKCDFDFDPNLCIDVCLVKVVNGNANETEKKNHYRNNFVKKQELIETERALQVHKPLVFAPITASVIK